MQDPRRVDPELRRKYDVRGPRYTSYPPAPHFHPIDPDALFARWAQRNGLADDPGLSLYVHVPFCRSRCLFCGCHTVISRDAAAMDAYVDMVVAEAGLAARLVSPSRPVRQLALGGGTPNALDEAQTDRLLTAIERTWAFAPDAERSVEVDPRTVTPAKLDVFLAHGFNRFSLGVQDFDPDVLAVIRRGQATMQVEEVVGHLRARGCEAINFDLVYGLPGQTPDSFAATADAVVRLHPGRVALYSYAHVPWVQPHQKALERHGLPDPDVKLALFLAMLDRLEAAGYVAIGLDHFALPEDGLARAFAAGTLRRNFMGYTTCRGTDLLAFGASSISGIGSTYSQDAKGLVDYAQGIEEGRLPVERGYLLTPDDELRRELIIDLFCNFAVDLDALRDRFGEEARRSLDPDLERLAPLAADGLVEVTDAAVTVSPTGRFFVRNVCMTFDRHLGADGGAAVYSRTV